MNESKNLKYFVFLILVGAISGTFAGDILGNRFSTVAFLKDSYSVGTPKPFILDLKVLSITFGLNFNINIMSIVGIIVAIIIIGKNRK
ncbi:MAG: DUF4321 domain-containing protein [Bacillota bacterium]|nr:DUF4321 domain-containing protein [Bacillota bacterium]